MSGAPGRGLNNAERSVLAAVFAMRGPRFSRARLATVARLVEPINQVARTWDPARTVTARMLVLAHVHRTGRPYTEWIESDWVELTGARQTAANREARLYLVALGHQLGGHHRLHHRAGVQRLKVLSELVFGAAAVEATLKDVTGTLACWGVSDRALHLQVCGALCDLLLTCNTPELGRITEDQFTALVGEYGRGTRRNGLTKLSRVLAHKRLISRPIKGNDALRGHWEQTLASVPAEWLDWTQCWRRLAVHEPGTVRTMFSTVLIAGRWAAERHPDAVSPDRWTRDIAAEYVADTMHAVTGQWAGNNRNRSRLGQALSASGKANRIDSIRSFFCDLVEWEWITPRFDPRRVLSLPCRSARSWDPTRGSLTRSPGPNSWPPG